MFHLVKYRYLFLLISLIVIIPGVASLIFKGLNVGIDFAGGANVELRPQTNMTIAQMTDLLKPLNLSSLQVVITNPTNASSLVGKTVWIRLNRQIDTNVVTSIQDSMQQKYPGVKPSIYTLPLQPPVTMIVFENFSSAPKVSDIQTLLTKLPNTSDPTKGPAPVPTPTPAAGITPTATTGVTPTATVGTTPTATVGATATPKASATAGATATATVAATAAPTPTAVPTNPAIFPVFVTTVVQNTSSQDINILTRTTKVTTSEITNMITTIIKANGPYTQLISNSEVSGSVASETTNNSFLAVLAASFFILLYVWFSFRKVSKPWRYGTCAIIALLHDVLVVVGVFSILGWTLHIQIDSLFITALLTVVGFSVHDTIVVFDRIRENMQRRTSESFEQVVDASLIQTLARSLNTSLTVLFTLSALTLFSNAGSVRNFTLALLIGIFSGTYSSIFNASMLLVMWEKSELFFKFFNHDSQPPVNSKRNTRERELSGTRG